MHRRSRPGPKGINWEALATEYITAEPKLSYRDLAAKHGLSESSVSRRGKRDQWPERREQHMRQIACKTQAKVEEKIATDRADEAVDAVTFMNEAIIELRRLIDSGALKCNSLEGAANALCRVILTRQKLIEDLEANAEPEPMQEPPRELTEEEIDRYIELAFCLAEDRERPVPGWERIHPKPPRHQNA